MSSRKAPKRKKESQSRRIIDKFSLKTWYTVHAPEIFGGEELAETPSADPEYLINRTLETTMMDLTGEYKKMHVKLTFKIDKTKGDHAYTQFNGHEYTRDYLRSMIRRRRTRIDGIINVMTKDGARLRTSIIALTPFRCKASHERGIRKIMIDVATKKASKLSFEKYVKDLVSGKLATEIYKQAKKIHPVQNVDIWKSRVINLPTMILEEEPKPAPEAETKSPAEIVEEKPAET
ncbi:MAG TPA: 30S ribosomal protein S3ae [candidate division Zixibacteria bacterium]|nr:30S ribosomal protein S3ae [candidate division Zixibacteria bacterium]